jgi:photosystem II stability/assembly factor-like uncharacterized protein
MIRNLFRSAALAAALLLATHPAAAQRGNALPNPAPDTGALAKLVVRAIGPVNMSGRVVAIAVPEGPASQLGNNLGKVAYVAGATAGVWKTTNGGTTWTPVFDEQSSLSIGDVAVAPSNPDIVWVGTGESNNQRSSSWGDGVYKSENGGKTWQKMGLSKSQHIGRIAIHPTNPSIVFIASCGPLWGAGGERGLYRTVDGGKTWVLVKNISPNTGFTEVVIDPKNPDIVYAASFQRERSAYNFIGGGPETAIWKSIDGGTTWRKLTVGLPPGDMGRIGLAIARSRPATIYATLDEKGSAVYRSDDYGESWKKMTAGFSYPWYMGKIFVDPNDPETVYFPGVPMSVSRDGAKTWKNIANDAHSDFHVAWIDPNDSQHIWFGSDGGLYTSKDGGETVDWMPNLPFAQFYAIGVDMRRPYWVYGGLQDNGEWAGPSATRHGAGITRADWRSVWGGDGFHAQIDPVDNRTAYVESQGGALGRYDLISGEGKSIAPEAKAGTKALRYNWSAPILISPHDHNTIYFGANFLFKSTNRGDAWRILGQDMTRQRKSDSLPMMGKIWPKTAVSYHQGVQDYGNMSTLDESPVKQGILYVGTDDGVVSASTDGGTTWQRYTKFPGVPEETYVSRVVASPSSANTIYATFDGHRSNDFRPYVLKSTDNGKNWKSIAGNLPENGSVHIIREHPRNPNLLFVGTEFGAFYSINGGKSWTKIRGNLPSVIVHDIIIHPRENDLVIGTHARGIFIIDDISPLEKLAEARTNLKSFALFPVRPASFLAFDQGGSEDGSRTFYGPNPPYGSMINYFVGDSTAGKSVKLEILDQSGGKVRTLQTSSAPGLHRVVWDFTADPPVVAPDPSAPRGFEPSGPAVAVGTYTARLTLSGGKDSTGNGVRETPVVVERDPAVILADAEYRTLVATRAEATRVYAQFQNALNSAKLIQTNIKGVKAVLGKVTVSDSITKAANEIEKEITDIMKKMTGASAGGGSIWDSDPNALRQPSIQERLGLGYSLNTNNPVTEQEREDLTSGCADLEKEIPRINALLTVKFPALNRMLDAARVPWTPGRALPPLEKQP